MPQSGVLRFDGFVLDEGQRILSRDGRPLHLTRKAFDLLILLIAHAPRVVSKDELHRKLWPDTFVTDATVAGVVKELRRVLGVDASGEPFVRTAHGVGYAFTGAVQATDHPVDAPARFSLVSGTLRLLLATGANDIGRDPQAAVRLDSPHASRRHARITIADGTATLEDLGSKNRTLLNDSPLGLPTVLTDGDSIQIGPQHFVFRVIDVMATTETERSESARRVPIDDHRQAGLGRSNHPVDEES